MSFKIFSSPLQGFTDFRFRNNFDKFFGCIDGYYAPYIRINGDFNIKSSYQRDLQPDNNTVKGLIPQVLTNCAEEFLFVAQYVKALGYNELNWNLGCPYPMVTKRLLGSGLLKNKETIDHILAKVFTESDIEISIKMRLGYESNQEILQLLPILNKYKLKNLVIHPRLGKQLYKGQVDLEAFERCTENTDHKIIYNGDIDSVERFRELQQRFSTIDHWAIGRSVIANPFLVKMLKNNYTGLPNDWIDTFSSFHDALFQGYDDSLSGPSHIVLKMQSYWEYFAQMFSNPHKAYKSIRKAKNVNAYYDAVRAIIREEKSELNS